MPRRAGTAWAATAAALLAGVAALDNGLARRPPMGWNSWNAYVTAARIRAAADALVALGLRDAGYVYLNVDDGWAAPARGADGRLEADAGRFPGGLAALAEYAHARGLLFGAYGDRGDHTCMGLPGSRGHEAVDAHTFAAWGVDFLKYDNCFSPDDEPPRGAYEAMRDALNATGRPVLFSVCDWGAGDVWEWGAGVGNAWRTTPDVAPTWASILANAQATAGLARFAGPGGWNDPDMLEVGNAPLSLLPRAWTAQFALWCVLKAPLLVGADLTRLHADALRLLTNADLIAWNQDPLGVAGDRVWQAGPYSAWVAPLADGGRAVALLCTRPPDVQPHASNATIPWAALGLAPGDGGARAVRDALAQGPLAGGHATSAGLALTVDAESVRAVTVGPAAGRRGDDGWRPWHAPGARRAAADGAAVRQARAAVGAASAVAARRHRRAAVR